MVKEGLNEKVDVFMLREIFVYAIVKTSLEYNGIIYSL